MQVFLSERGDLMDTDNISLDFILNLFEKDKEKQIVKYILDESDEHTIVEELIKLKRGRQENDQI